MKSFLQFISELTGAHVPVVSIDKTQVDLNDDDTVDEINKNLSIATSKDFTSIESALLAVKKILSMYGIELPEVELKHRQKASISIPIAQFKSSGENHSTVTPPLSERNEKHKVEISFEQINGTYDVKAKVSKI